MIHAFSERVRPDPLDVMWHYAQGQVPDWIDGEGGPVVWKWYSHRGIQRLDNIRIPRKQRRYIDRPRFQIGRNRAFEQVVQACADTSREGKTWITDELIEAFVSLHRMGFAYSTEAWLNGRLAGGLFGLHMGGYVSVESMFYYASNASKAAYGRTLLDLRDRGFTIVDTTFVAPHHVNYGEEWIPQWLFRQMLRSLLRERISLADDCPCRVLPWQIRTALPLARVCHGIDRRVGQAAERGLRGFGRLRRAPTGGT